MTALAKAKGLKEDRWKHRIFTLTSGKKAWQGAIACLDVTTGKVTPGAAAANLLPIGVFGENVDATAAALPVNVDLLEEIELAWYANATGADEVLATDVGKIAFIKDDQTVQITQPAIPIAAGRVWGVDSLKGVAVQQLRESIFPGLGALPVVGAFVANAYAPAGIVNGGLYDVPATAAGSVITLPVAAKDGTVAYFVADGTKNGHTVQYKDETGAAAITTALTASKRHAVVVAKRDGLWYANAYVSP